MTAASTGMEALNDFIMNPFKCKGKVFPLADSEKNVIFVKTKTEKYEETCETPSVAGRMLPFDEQPACPEVL